ncbi:DUF2142 domain-containing protein [Agrococcus sp. Marseille-Q4369]|uniref:DUF2142 domain-containing protein n=1 Tax=Agrococcus sp. Marseille-Q4369 TaxID=2810513 RepID=UPI001B8BF38C|nr:DUF2142 domain-containing protein [Agrococcus sp. Marseille-Q4369]QUW18566.1 DUF2142 domain-containing protein [Agrococcus sp. Marseille-Q4369]
MTPATAGREPRRPWRRLVALIAVPVAMVVALLSWAVSSPPGSSPDDDFHMASIWCAGGPVDDRCEIVDDDARLVPDAISPVAACYVFVPTSAGACPVREGVMTPTDRGNWVDESYPPLFYSAMSAFVSDDIQTSVVLMRAANAVLYVGVMVLLLLLLPPALRPVLTWGAAISIVPLGMFLVPSVNPSSWALISASGLWLATLGWFRQEGWRRWALGALAAALLAIGAGARSDAAIYAVLGFGAASVLAFEPARRYAIRLVLPIVLSVAAAAAYFSTGLSGSIAENAASNEGLFERRALAFDNLRQLPDLWIGVFGDFGVGGLGWLDTDMPAVSSITAAALFAAIAFAGLRRGGVRKWIALAGVGAALVVLPMYMLLLNDVRVGEWVQPRYIFPMVIMIGGLALVEVPGRRLELGRPQIVLAAAALTLAHSMALHANLRRYVTGVDVLGFNLDRAVEWWWATPVSPMTLWAVGSLAFAAAVATLVAVGWRGGSSAAAARAHAVASTPPAAGADTAAAEGAGDARPAAPPAPLRGERAPA